MKLFDRWSLIHIASGIAIGTIAYEFSQWFAVLVTFGMATAWELFENTSFGTRLMQRLGDTEFRGDDKVHSVADIIVTTLGGVIGCSVASSVNTTENVYGTSAGLCIILILLYIILRVSKRCTPQEKDINLL